MIIHNNFHLTQVLLEPICVGDRLMACIQETLHFRAANLDKQHSRLHLRPCPSTSQSTELHNQRWESHRSRHRMELIKLCSATTLPCKGIIILKLSFRQRASSRAQAQATLTRLLREQQTSPEHTTWQTVDLCATLWGQQERAIAVQQKSKTVLEVSGRKHRLQRHQQGLPSRYRDLKLEHGMVIP